MFSNKILSNISEVTNLWKSLSRPIKQDEKNQVNTLTEAELVRDQIIRQRQEYASDQDYDYSHVFR